MTYESYHVTDEQREHLLGKDRHFWDAHAQGRFARFKALRRDSNPWRGTAHANEWDWDRGWCRGY